MIRKEGDTVADTATRAGKMWKEMTDEDKKVRKEQYCIPTRACEHPKYLVSRESRESTIIPWPKEHIPVPNIFYSTLCRPATIATEACLVLPCPSWQAHSTTSTGFLEAFFHFHFSRTRRRRRRTRSATSVKCATTRPR